MAVSGANRFNSDLRYQHIQSIMPGSLQERTRPNLANLRESMDFSMLTTLIGSVPILAAFIIKFMR